MSVDPQQPDSFDDPADARTDDGTIDGATEGTDDRAIEGAPEADAAEQRAEVEEEQDLDLPAAGRPGYAEGEVNPADAAEQARIVSIDEDEYR